MPDQYDHLFRFVSVRPVQNVAPDERQTLFIEPPPSDSMLVAALDRALTFADRQVIAAEYVRSNGYVRGFTERMSWIGALRAVLAILAAVDTDAELQQARRRLRDMRSRPWPTA